MDIFQPFPKLARLSRECVVTEKLDGTNAQIVISVEGLLFDSFDRHWLNENRTANVAGYSIYAGSRTRLITPGKLTDNFGFAAWVKENAEELVKLGPGRHFGEWYGQGIQRAYGLKERRFALFNTHGIQSKPDCVSVVPVLYEGPFDTTMIEWFLTTLRIKGSQAVPGFMDPEGIVVWHNHARVAFKKTFDDKHKEAA